MIPTYIAICIYLSLFVYIMHRCLKHQMYSNTRVKVSTTYFLLFAIGSYGLFIDNLPILVVFATLGWLLDYCCEIYHDIMMQQKEKEHRQQEWKAICAGGKMNKQYDWLK